MGAASTAAVKTAGRRSFMAVVEVGVEQKTSSYCEGWERAVAIGQL
jgi:hypothetical protein